MAAGNSSRRQPNGKLGGTIDEQLAPLFAAAPAPPSGRIRSLDEARRALRIPTSAEPDVLKAWGVPSDLVLTAVAVNDQQEPDLVAEFAALRVIQRQGRQLVARHAGTRLRLREKSNALWIVYGSIVKTSDSPLVIESLAIGPALTRQFSQAGDDPPHGVTTELLRLISPPQLLSATVEQLRRNGHWLAHSTDPNTTRIPQAQQEALDILGAARTRQSHIPEEQLVAIAQRYIVLWQRGNRHPLPQIASEFGLTRAQIRDRVHKARNQGYLTRGKQGRAGATIGPRLKALGWTPPQPPTRPGHPAPDDSAP